MIFLHGDIELVNVGVQVKDSRKFTLSAVYRPPGGNIDRFLQTLSENVASAKLEFGGDCVILGDMNIDYAKPRLSHCTKLKGVADKFGLDQIISSDTRVTDKSHSTIDLILTDLKNISKSGTLNVNISDHFPVYMVKKKTRNEIRKKIVFARNYKALGENAFQLDIDSIDRNHSFDDSDPNVIWSKLLSHIRLVTDRHCPKIEMKVTIDRPNFLTDEILKLMRERDISLKRARCLGDPAYWEEARALERRVRTLIYKTRRSYICQNIANAKGDGRKFLGFCFKRILWQTQC